MGVEWSQTWSGWGGGVSLDLVQQGGAMEWDQTWSGEGGEVGLDLEWPGAMVVRSQTCSSQEGSGAGLDPEQW